MSRFIPIGVLLALRAIRSRHRVAMLLTVLAVATSVALASGLEIGARAVESELNQTADRLVGAARLEISGGALGIPEELLEEVSALDCVQTAAPVIQATVFLTGEHEEEPLRLLGVDFLSDRAVTGSGIA